MKHVEKIILLGNQYENLIITIDVATNTDMHEYNFIKIIEEINIQLSTIYRHFSRSARIFN